MRAVRFIAAVAAFALWTPSEARGDPVKLRTSDGLTVIADHQGSGAKGVVLVHGAERSSADWTSFARRLGGNGFSVLAVDLRGHGASRSAVPDLASADWPAMSHDVEAAAQWLSDHGAEQVGVVGAELGASLAVLAAADSDVIARLVLLSPSLNDHGVRLSGALGAVEVPMLVVADARNPAEARTASILGQSASSAVVERVAAGSSGHRMLNTVPDLEGRLVAWLHGATDDTPVGGARARALDASAAPGSIETTGTAYGESP